MEDINLGDSFLGFIPNISEKRKVIDQRKARSLDRIINHSRYFQTNEDKLEAVYSKKEHIVRLLFTSDYPGREVQSNFEVKERLKSITTGKKLQKPLSEYYIKGVLVSSTEYEFGQYLVEKFGSTDENKITLSTIISTANDENEEIKKIVAQKSEKIQQQNQKRLEENRALKTQAVQKFKEAVHQFEFETNGPSLKNRMEIDVEDTQWREKKIEEIVQGLYEFGADYDDSGHNLLGETYKEAYRRFKERHPEKELEAAAKSLSGWTGENVSIEEMKEIRARIAVTKAVAKTPGNYMVVESNEGGELLGELAGRVITKELIDELKINDRLATQETDKFYKCYIREVKNTKTVDKLRIDIGEGKEVNSKLFEYLESKALTHEAAIQIENKLQKTEEKLSMVEKNQEVNRSIMNLASSKVDKGLETNVPILSEDASFNSKDLAQKAIELIKEYKNNPDDVKEYLDFMSKFPELSPRNLALLEKQWPGANMVATYNQWAGKTTDSSKKMGEVLNVSTKDIDVITRTVTNKKTGEVKTITLDKLSVRQGEKSKISLLRGQEDRYIEKKRNGKVQAHWEKFWSKEEKSGVESGQIEVKSSIKFIPYKVFEISQTNINPDSLPHIMPNRHVNFEADPKLLKSMTTGLEIYASSIGVEVSKTAPGATSRTLGNAKGAATIDGKKITMNHLNTPSENVSTLIHELAHSTLHKGGSANHMSEQYAKQEFEAEMTSYVVSKRYGIDTSSQAIPYIASWTKNMKKFSGAEGEKELSQSLSRVQKASHAMVKKIDAQINPVLKQTQRLQKQAVNKTQEVEKFSKKNQPILNIGR